MPRHRPDPDDDSGEYAAPRRKKANSGLMVLGIVAGGFVAVMLLCGGGCLYLTFSAGKVRQQENERQEAASVPIQLGQEHRIGDLGITVEWCREMRVESTTSTGRELISDQPYTVIRIRLKNYNPAKNANPKAQTGYAKVFDDLGNELKPIKLTSEWGLGTSVREQIDHNKMLDLRSDQTGSDLILVERTVPAAKRVTAKLDARQYGGEGYLVADLQIKK